MSVDARERLLTLLSGEEPDRVPIFASDRLRTGSQGGWVRRLVRRGLGIFHIVGAYIPWFSFPGFTHPGIEDLIYTQTQFIEGGVQKIRHVIETPVGTITSTTQISSLDLLVDQTPTEFFIKEAKDWHVLNDAFKRIYDTLYPNYEQIKLEEDALGETGLTIAVVEKTPFQRAWIELADPVQAFLTFKEQPEELLEFLETQRRLHERIAEITAGCPAKLVLILDNITNMISPNDYRAYCLPYYELHSRAVEGTGKVLACHMDGLLGHLKGEIADSPIDVIDSLTIPPSGNVSITEAKATWGDKIIFVNCPPHLTWVDTVQMRQGYYILLAEWEHKRFAIAHIEDIPLERVELHLSTALDVCGYPD